MFGYAGKILRVDLSSGTSAEIATAGYADRFLGGRGIAAKLYWDEVPPRTGALEAENALILATGPMAGVPVVGGSRWEVCGKSPAPSPEHFCNCNLGGRWGLDLKSAGYDAILIRGRSEKPVYLFLHDGVCEFKSASALWGRGAMKTRDMVKSELGPAVSVACIGPAGENMATMAIMLAEDDAAGGGGLGAVMGSKNLKAIAVPAAAYRANVAKPERLKELTAYFRSLGKTPIEVAGGVPMIIKGPRTKRAPCYGCLGHCLRRTYESEDGHKGKLMCQAGTFYLPLAEAYYGPGYEVQYRATKLCDDYGLDTMAVVLIILWLQRCRAAGILSDENTGIPLSKMGSLEFIESLVRQIACREGFGDVLARGVEKAAEHVGASSKAKLAIHHSKAGYPGVSEPRLYTHTALLYAVEPRPPMHQTHEVSRIVLRWLEWRRHEEHSYMSPDVARRIANRFWGSEAAADYSTAEGKALAARMIQDREYAEACLVLCTFIWPIMDLESSADHVGDPSLESQLISAVLGRDIDERGLCGIGERVFNMQRAILVKEGHRGRQDDLLPETWHTVPLRGDLTNPECVVLGKEGEPVSRKGMVVDREAFERTKDEYYQLRHWNVSTGLQTRDGLAGLGMVDIAQGLEQRGLLSG
ncbi:MAG: hypothetical protein NTU41_08000 [Chloroflexi bacterium]|nr:hypothetical protein [Chloroflexota bacterium]